MSVGAFGDGDWFEVRRLLGLLNGKLDELLRTALLTDAQGVGVRFGIQNVSFAASVSGSATVTHGLGKTPVAVLATAASGTNGLVNATVGSVGATTFAIGARYVDAVARTSTEPVYWVVIG